MDLAVKIGKLAHLCSMQTNAALRLRYDQITAHSYDALKAGETHAEKLFGTKVPGLVLMVGPEQFPAELSAALVQAQRETKGDEANVRLVAPTTFHLGVFKLNPTFNYDMDNATGEKTAYTGKPVYQERFYHQYVEQIERVVSRLTPIEVEFHGICSSTGAIFAQGYDRGRLNLLRTELFSALDLIDLPFADRIPDIVHGTLARFIGPLRDPAGFIERVYNRRTTDYGSLVVNRLMLAWEETAYLESYSPIIEFPLLGARTNG